MFRGLWNEIIQVLKVETCRRPLLQTSDDSLNSGTVSISKLTSIYFRHRLSFQQTLISVSSDDPFQDVHTRQFIIHLQLNLEHFENAHNFEDDFVYTHHCS